MKYEVILSNLAVKQFKKLSKQLVKKMQQKLDALQSDPRPAGAKKLAGKNSLYRLREGKYRIIYEIHKEELIVLVLIIADRKEVYSKKFLK